MSCCSLGWNGKKIKEKMKLKWNVFMSGVFLSRKKKKSKDKASYVWDKQNHQLKIRGWI